MGTLSYALPRGVEKVCEGLARNPSDERIDEPGEDCGNVPA
jgi:hypothetical protein